MLKIQLCGPRHRDTRQSAGHFILFFFIYFLFFCWAPVPESPPPHRHHQLCSWFPTLLSAWLARVVLWAPWGTSTTLVVLGVPAAAAKRKGGKTPPRASNVPLLYYSESAQFCFLLGQLTRSARTARYSPALGRCWSTETRVPFQDALGAPQRRPCAIFVKKKKIEEKTYFFKI